jgi:hypothetical protein
MRRLLHSLLRAAALAVPLACTGCFTMLTWTGAPRVHVDRLRGANVDAAGELTVGVAMSDGRVCTYRETTRSCSKLGPDQHCFLQMVAIDELGGDAPFAIPPSSDGLRLELPATLQLENGGVAPLALIVDPRKRGAIEIVDAEGVRRAWLDVPRSGETNWIHPGTWLCIVATPVTAVADLVLFPLELLCVYSIFPRS